MRGAWLRFLKVAAVTVAVLFLVGAMLTAVTDLFGGSKVRTLFLDSRDALEGSTDELDAGPAPVERPRKERPVFFPASKSGPL